jgi:hypothetical protein
MVFAVSKPYWLSALVPPPNDEVTCFAAIGRFLVGYAIAEGAVHVATRHFSGIDDASARIIFAGMRLRDLQERLRALTQSKPIYKEIDECLTQLSLIRDERDKIVHRHVEFDASTGLKVHNILISKKIEDSEWDTFTARQLADLEADCEAIFYRLGILTDSLPTPNLKRISLLDVYAPWRHKRAQQEAGAKRNPRKRK